MTDSLNDFQWTFEPLMLELTEVKRSTFAGWVAAGVIESAPSYGEGTVLEVAMIAAARPYLTLQELSAKWSRLRANDQVKSFVTRARKLGDGERFDLVIDLQYKRLSVPVDNAELLRTIRSADAPRPFVVVPLAPRLLLIREAFRDLAQHGTRPTERKAGRPPVRRSASVTELR
jgi:hypothetical protein